ncbi:hypothetical protein CH275_09640 [Rhodococcus sp. 06-235-1A]|nr:hypothetical protein CH275_09640 [Rhodococcus sp. 06-235-1A]
MRGRQLVVVDVHTTGPSFEAHEVFELAAIDGASGRVWDLALPLTSVQLERADPTFLQLSGYHRRRLGEKAQHDASTVESELAALSDALAGNTLGGADPEIHAAFLSKVFHRHGVRSCWHHLPVDIAALTAGAHGIPATNIPRLEVCCELWDVQLAEFPSALDRAHAVAGCFAAFDRSSGRESLLTALGRR